MGGKSHWLKKKISVLRKNKSNKQAATSASGAASSAATATSSSAAPGAASSAATATSSSAAPGAASSAATATSSSADPGAALSAATATSSSAAEVAIGAPLDVPSSAGDSNQNNANSLDGNRTIPLSALIVGIDELVRHATKCSAPRFLKELRKGLETVVQYECAACASTFDVGKNEEGPLNCQAVDAAVTAGSGHSAMKTQMALMDVPFMSFNYYANIEATNSEPNPEKSEASSGGWSGAGDSTPPSKRPRRHSGSPHSSPAAPVPLSAPLPAPDRPVPRAPVSAPAQAPVPSSMMARDSALECSVPSENPRSRRNFGTAHSPPPPPPTMSSSESHLLPPSAPPTEIIKIEQMDLKEEEVDVGDGDCDTPLDDPLGEYSTDGVGLSGEYPEENPGLLLAALSEATPWNAIGRGPVYRGLVTQRAKEGGGSMQAAAAAKVTKAKAAKAKAAKAKAAKVKAAKVKALIVRVTKPKATKAISTRPLPTHPPTYEMVLVAIWVLKERSGSSLIAIKKYIDANYIVNIQRLATFIKRALKSGVAGGTLVQYKGKGASGSFKLSPAAVKSVKQFAKAHKMPAAAKPKQREVQLSVDWST